MDTLFWAFTLRFGQSVIEASLTLVIGAIIAGVFRRMVGPASTRKLFGRGLRGLLRGWIAGMLLPVCSLGVIPVAREMRRSGVPGGTVLAFVLAAPLLNPISFLYGLTLAEPIVILTFAGFSLVLSTLAGWLWDRCLARDEEIAEALERARKADAEPTPVVGPRRLLAVVVTAARELAGRDLWLYLIGLSGSALLSAAIPFGALQHTMHFSDKLAPLEMAALAVPIFSSPLPGMMKIGLMFDHGNSIGATFVLFALGIGTSLGTLAWIFTDFGGRRGSVWFASYVAIILGLAYLSDVVLYDTRKAEAGHTHAFDDYSSPFPAGSPDLPVTTFKKLSEKFGELERPAVYTLAGLIALGFLIRVMDTHGRLERWLTTLPLIRRESSKWDMVVPGPVLAAVVLLGLVAFSVLGAYLYYPDRKTCRDQMAAIYADAAVAVKTGRQDEAVLYLERWDLLVRKLEVGEFLREFGVTAEQSKSAEELREALETVRDHLLAGDQAAAHADFVSQVESAYRELKQTFSSD